MREDCFGRFTIYDDLTTAAGRPDRCEALKLKSCQNCNFYKPLSAAIGEWKKYGYTKHGITP